MCAGWSKHGLLLPALCAWSLASHQAGIAAQVEGQLPLSSGTKYWTFFIAMHWWSTNSELISKDEIPLGVQSIISVLLCAEPVTQCCEVWMPDKLYIHPGYWHGAHPHNGPSAWTVLGHSRGAFLLLSMILIIVDCLSLLTTPTRRTYNVYLSQGKGVWNVCLCGAHLWDQDGLP